MGRDKGHAYERRTKARFDPFAQGDISPHQTESSGSSNGSGRGSGHGHARTVVRKMPISSGGIHINEPTQNPNVPHGRTKMTAIRGRGKGKAMASGPRAPRQDEDVRQDEERTTEQPLKLHMAYKGARFGELGRHVVDYTKRAEKVKKERYEYPFVYEKSAADYRFWNEFQVDFYETVILKK